MSTDDRQRGGGSLPSDWDAAYRSTPPWDIGRPQPPFRAPAEADRPRLALATVEEAWILATIRPEPIPAWFAHITKGVTTLLPRSTARRPRPHHVYGGGMESFVLTIIGTDRAGLVDALSEVVVEHGGSWERSQMTELAGMFAGMVLVRVPSDRAEGFREALTPLHDQGLMDVTLRAAVAGEPSTDTPTLRFEVVGSDRPGIVHEVSHLLAEHGIGIVDLRTWTESAAMAGSQLFRAAAAVRLPADVSTADLTDALEGLSDDLMVDLLDD